MADETRDNGPQSDTEDPREANAAAIAIALDGARDRPELSGPIAGFLNDQRSLIAEQRHHLHEQLKRVKLGIIDQRFSIALKAMTALVGLAIAGVLAFMTWDAIGSDGLVIESFSVPPDFAQRGLSGQTVASRVLDRMTEMQKQTNSQRAPQSYANYWGDDIKVEIPETGISLGELDRFLRERLGHSTRVTGDVVQTSSGVSLAARIDGGGVARVYGPSADFDALIGKLGEAVYKLTQPYLYGVYLSEHGRQAEAEAQFTALAENGPAGERAWGYIGWSNTLELANSEYARLAMLRQTAARAPDLLLPRQNMAMSEDALDLPEQAIHDSQAAMPILLSSAHGGIRAEIAPISYDRMQALIDLNLGAFHDASQLLVKSAYDFQSFVKIFGVATLLVRSESGEHDLAAARATLADIAPKAVLNNTDAGELDNIWVRILVDTEAQDWSGVLGDDRAIPPLFVESPGLRSLAYSREIPWIAFAHAKLGDFKAAEALVSHAPASCQTCLLMRARIAEAQGQHARADRWFAQAVLQQPSIPFAYSQWGEALLARGNADSAIAKFREANRRGPRFADPLEMWGEALMQENRSDLALAKFEEADKYAPNWGRLHLEWGRALLYSGHKEEARRQFAIATSLELSPSDKAALVGASAMH
jgi:tetratricopeptide (TPR) repeat protein